MSAIRVFLIYITIVNFAGTCRLVRNLVEVRYSECPLRESSLYIAHERLPFLALD